MKTALITGVTGQDGSYLAELLLEKGYHVHGIKRRSSSFNTDRINHIYQELHEKNQKFTLHYGDLTDSSNLIRIIGDTEPDEIYNLGAQSHVQVSFETPEYTANTDALGTLRMLEAVRLLKMTDRVRFYQASTSELYGLVQEVPQSESTPFYPRSPYGVAKLYAFWIVKNYRESYGMYACNGILFNHESPRRGETFVTRKITRAAARIAAGLQKCLYLGNMDARRDWGYAGDYVKGMWLMLQQKKPMDILLATGKMTSVRDFVRKAFKRAGIDLEFRGSGADETAVDAESGITRVAVDPRYFRPAEVEQLCGNPQLAAESLGWSPETQIDGLISMMVDADIAEARRDKHLSGGGFSVRNEDE